MRGWARRALAGWWLAGAALSGWALEPATPLAEYARQAWVMENGLPQDTVQALTQTRDGFVWIGTEAGLARFDGVAFAVFDKNSNPALPSGDVRCLLETSDGALWVGTSDGLARWQGGTVRTFTTEDGLPGNTILALRVNERGAVLVSTESGTVGIEDSKVVPAIADAGAGAAAFSARLTDGSRAQATVSTVTLTQHGKESQWSVRKELPGSRVQALFADREGCLWIGTNGGLARIVHGVVQRLAVTDPLAGASILTMMEDREGDVWVGTETSGLHILRDQRFRTISMHEGLSSDATTTVVEDGKGALWIGTSGGALNVFRRSGVKSGAASVYAVRDVLLSDVILSLAAAPNGDLWVGTPDGLNRIRGSAVDAYTSADGLPDDFIRSLLVDADGSLWIGTRRGLAHWMFPAGGAGREHAAAKIVTYTQASGLGSDLVGAMARDKAGDLWVATFAGLSRLHGGAITNYTTANGLSSNVVTALLARPSGELFIGTQDHGWNLWDGHSFSAPKGRGLSEKSIHAILDDAGNHLWFATDEGIARCDCTMTAECTHWIEFGPADGLRSRETATNSHPSAWRSRDGLLWFATPKGLVEADPAHFAINTEPPLVAIERFAVDDVEQPLGDGAGLRLQAGHVHFEFDYAGLSFVAPQKVRYRYMLEGFDKQWTEAGARRTAYYTNIPPGRYVLRVQAANNDGVWNEQGAALRFELRPHFYQTIWFYLVLAVLLGALVVVLLRLRLMRAEREFRAVLGERSRIAREIHDTLAQGYVGISVQLEVLAELLRQNKSDAAAKQLDTARSQVRDGLADARQSIWALRSQDSGEKTLPVELRRVTEQAGGHGLEANFSIYGAYRALPPGTEREILRVAQEAIHNVKKHAGARNLTVQLEYRQNEIALEVRDDGRGFAAEGGAQSPPGHFGLTGMRERAAAIKGVLDVTSETGGGTTVRLRVPARKEQKEST
ncbi:MAG: hypothetical protein KGJ51_02100 [Acidobacteriota bacterium]|nr:hypothetical protein [Acidobacteriota bacterium]